MIVLGFAGVLLGSMGSTGTRRGAGGAAEDRTRCVPVRSDAAASTFRVGEGEAKFSLISDETLLIIHVFVDHRIMEVCINGREVMTT